jgi:hypothetical protein
MRKLGITGLALAALLATTAAASAQVCILGIFAAAAYVSKHENRELTQEEALSCGMTYFFSQKKEEPKKKKITRRVKKPE